MKLPQFYCDIPGVPSDFIEHWPYNTASLVSCRKIDDNLYEMTDADGTKYLYDDISKGVRGQRQGYSHEEAQRVWMREFGTRLGYILRARQMTAKDLAEQTGISVGSISGYINGKNVVSAFSLIKICKVLNASIEYFTDFVDI